MALLSLARLFALVRRLGLRLEVVGNAPPYSLRCGPSDLLTDEVRGLLALHKPVIVAALLRWGPQTGLHVLWFLHTSFPPSAPFHLDPARRVLDPTLLWCRLYEDVQAGPRSARARTGALQADLRLLYEHPAVSDEAASMQGATTSLVTIRGP